MPVIDLIIIILIGFFVFTRFFGQKLPIDKQLKQAKKIAGARVVDFPKTPQPEKDDGKIAGLADLKQADPSFREKDFLAGAKKAYQFFYKSWNEKDDEKLANLVSPNLLDQLIADLNEMDEKKQSPAVKIESINTVKILEARLHGKSALIDVQFTVKQSENTMKEGGSFVGKEKPIKEIKTVWTFARALTAEDPNWELESISKPN
ncbi:MAG: Tim44/TimA family putative adaptor protein [Alphaproteobacteria bacterium]|nr:Tim44/TimA family putative adaptor protein [Alphaproteobacteria bacterium]MDD9919248.1 Tim44/TimA family putative adaptor protein [Alphaproteobacteria bacterium]